MSEVKAPKTVNNILAVLSVLLKKAVEWEVIERMPCSIKLLPVPKGSTAFHDFDEYERLVEAARILDPRTHLIVLFGGDAGLRCGEMMALEWSDIDLVNRQVCIRRSDWSGHVTTPKGGRLRHVPLTRRLAAALSEHRHLRSAPARAIQELAGHKDLSMTQRYMHLSPAALDAAIRLLEQPNGPSQRGGSLQDFGDVVETGTDLGRKVNR